MEITFDNLFSNIDPKTKNHSNLFFKIKKPSDYILPSTSPIFQCILYKKQKIIKKEKPGNYHFYDEKCLYYDLSKKSSLKGVIFFHSNAKMEMLKKSFNPKNKAINEYYGFRLSKDHSEKEFYSNDTKLMEKIYKFLRKRIFQTNFHMNYKALKQLGRGNFATVYKSEKILSKEKYAIKAFSKESFANQDEKGLELLMNEIKIMRNLEHSNITNLIEIFETEKSVYLVMDLYKGKSLDQYLDEERKLDENKACIVLTGVLRGISYLTDKKIMHRDIKLQNVLFKKKDKNLTPNNVILVDFGLAQAEEDSQYIYTRCGTPGYVAPEILRAKDPKSKYTCACDVFSAGILLHLLLIGSKPFTSKNYNEVLNENKKFHFDRTEQKYSFLSNEAIDLLEKMLQPDPKKRIHINSVLKHDFFCSENLLSYPIGRSSMIFMSPEINMQRLKSCINMEKSNRFNREIQQISPKILCIKTENRTKGSGRMNDFEKSEDDTNSENDQSLFSNFFFNKSLYGNFNKSQQQYEVHSNDSKNSFERANNKNLSIKFLSTIRPSNSIENFAIKEDKNLKKKINSKIIIPFYEIDELDKKSNCSFHSTKGKSASSNNNQIRYSIDRNFKFEYDILKDSSSSNYHPKFWTNEEIQKQYGGKFKINSGYSSSNGSMNLGLNKPEEDMKIYSN